MPERGSQFPEDDFLSERGFTPQEQNEATKGAAGGAIDDVLRAAQNRGFMRHAFEQIMQAHSPEGQSQRVEDTKTELAVHGYHPSQIEHPTDEDGEVRPAAAHHHGDFTAHWEPGHDLMFVYHKSQDRSDANKSTPVGSIPVRHLHKQEGAHIPTVNQQALEHWHSDSGNVEKAMGKL